jgi:phosphoribosyl-AMP cyclohydrolase
MNIDINDIKFKKRISIEQVEESKDICPKFNKVGLLPCITIENETKMILMFSFINEEAFKRTISSKKGHYFSRSRNNVWQKGETSGMFHEIVNIYIDDDQDCVIYEVKLNSPKKGGKKASCHVGYKSCFYRKIQIKEGKIKLKFIEKEKSFDPEIVYEGTPNPTKL